MEKEGLINRVMISSRRPVPIEYYVTEKGKIMEPMLELIAEFSVKFEPKVIFEDGKQRDMDGLFGKKVRCLPYTIIM